MPGGDPEMDDVKAMDLIVDRVERVLAQKAWDDTVNVVLRATLTPAASANPTYAGPAAAFAVTVADHVAQARQLRLAVAQGAKVPLP